MKRGNYISLAAAAMLLASCAASEAVDFGADKRDIEAVADGGTHTVRISSGENWEASTAEPWITVSPANGRGTVECKIIIDSALTAEPRSGMVRFTNLATSERTEINITQQGYAYAITLADADAEVKIPNYAFYDERHFDVKVRSNVDFDIDIPEQAREWLEYDPYEVNLNRGLRPRDTKIRFKWGVSSTSAERIASVRFSPKASVTTARQDNLTVRQEAAPEIVPDTRQGDSVALVCISRALNMWYTWESTEPMDNWDYVTLWEEGMEGSDGKVGRVKSADFFLFNTKEGIPQEVQYLTAVESLSFRSNENSMLRDITPGEHLAKLGRYGNLKRLTIWAYGLSDLDDSFGELKDLEYLDLGANNFSDFPAVLRNGKTNFPNLHALVLNANQRSLVYDLSNTNSGSSLGGFIDATSPRGEFPRWLLEWEKLDTLVLGVNYLQGRLPDLMDGSWDKFYDAADVADSKNAEGVDTLPSNGVFLFGWNDDKEWKAENVPTSIIGLPKVWPNMRLFTINYNRMTGEVPDWLLFHPSLDWMMPFTFIFNYEGKDTSGAVSKFDNEPATTMDYYYKFYTQKKNPYDDGRGDDKKDGDCDCGCTAECKCDSCNR